MIQSMLTGYVKAAMDQAQFERLADGSFYGNIPGFEGVWASARTENICRAELQEVLEEWMLFRIRHHLNLPVIEDLDLNSIAT